MSEVMKPADVTSTPEEEEFELQADEQESASMHRSLPMPEPEAQPLQRPVPNQQQRPIRRVDRNADLPRGNRNGTSGDVIDIPAFLRKR